MNFNTYLSHQMAEDRRAFVVHYPAKSGKTQFARRASQVRKDIYYLDLQNYFLEHKELSPIGEFDPEGLKKMLLGLTVNDPVIIVDNPDFLINTWEKAQKIEFLNWLGNGLRSPNPTQKTFAFFVQNDPLFSSVTIKENTYREPRLFPLNQLDSI